MLVDFRVVGDGHHIELMLFHGAADGVQIGNRGEIAAVLAQEQLHVRVVVVAKFLGLNGLVFRGK